MNETIAIITGASSGLGAEFVKQLNDSNIDEIWVVARRRERLEALQAISKKKIVVLPLDLTDSHAIDRINHIFEVNQPHIAYLINNAGMGKLGAFEKSDRNTMNMMMLLNMNALVNITKSALPYMTKGDHIIQVCSASAFQPLPYLNIYSASKAFVYHFTLSLHEELKERGIKVTSVNPYWIKDTEFISIASEEENIASYPFATTKEVVVRRALKANENNQALCTPDLMSTIDHYGAKVLPKALLMKMWKGSLRL